MSDIVDNAFLPRLAVQNPRRRRVSNTQSRALSLPADSLVELVPEKEFQTFLHFERRRSQRHRKCFVLLLLEVGAAFQTTWLNTLASALRDSMRETDVAGWYKTGGVIGVVFTEVNPISSASISAVLLNKT